MTDSSSHYVSGITTVLSHAFTSAATGHAGTVQGVIAVLCNDQPTGYACQQQWVRVQVNAQGTLNPATHAYSFWEGVPASARRAFGALFAKSSTLRCVAVVQRAVRTCPCEFMANFGFGELQLMATISNVRMSGTRLCPPSAPDSVSCGVRCLCLVALLYVFRKFRDSKE